MYTVTKLLRSPCW